LGAFALYGPVAWNAVAVAAPCALLGGYGGARWARRLPAGALRWTVVAFSVAIGLTLL
jgi:hypothetical protein